MHEKSVIPSFQPSATWYEVWPHGISTMVKVMATISGPAASHAVQRFLEPLTHNPDADVPAGVNLYFYGGFIVKSTPPADGGSWQIVLASAGEDGFGSVENAAEDLTAALLKTPGEVHLSWHELPAAEAPDHGN